MWQRDSGVDLDRAMAQLSDIHAQISQAGFFRGYRAVTTGCVGVLALVAAAAQGELGLSRTLDAYLGYWLIVAVVCLGIVICDLLWRSRRRPQPGLGAQTRCALEQFLPAVAGGAVVTLFLFRTPHAVLLPGLWAILEGLGIAASRPFLPRMIQLCSFYFMAVGAWLLASAESAAIPSSWSMGICFGTGHLLAALVIYFQVERAPERGVVHDG